MWTIAVILIILWAQGVLSSSSMGDSIHFLLVVAIIIVAVRVINGRRLI
jgi:hypothetical protein